MSFPTGIPLFVCQYFLSVPIRHQGKAKKLCVTKNKKDISRRKFLQRTRCPIHDPGIWRSNVIKRKLKNLLATVFSMLLCHLSALK